MKRFLLAVLSTKEQLNIIDERLCPFCFDTEDISKKQLAFEEYDLQEEKYNYKHDYLFVENSKGKSKKVKVKKYFKTFLDYMKYLGFEEDYDNDLNKFGKWYNPNGKWDEYNEEIQSHIKAKRGIMTNQCQIKDIDWNVPFITQSILDTNNNWVNVFEEENQLEYFKSILLEQPNNWVTIVECIVD